MNLVWNDWSGGMARLFHKEIEHVQMCAANHQGIPIYEVINEGEGLANDDTSFKDRGGDQIPTVNKE